MHPALTGFLRSTRPPGASDEPGERWSRAFVDLMGQLAHGLAPRELHEQRGPFFLHGANFHVALGEAEHLGMDLDFKALIQSLAAHAQNTRNFQEAAHLLPRQGSSACCCILTQRAARETHRIPRWRLGLVYDLLYCRGNIRATRDTCE